MQPRDSAPVDDRAVPPIAVTFLGDSGAIYSVLPPAVRQALGLEPRREVDFSLADGAIITRGVSECTFEIAGMAATSLVVLGHLDEGPLLGAVTLETLGLVLHPLSRRLVPMRMLLATMSVRGSSASTPHAPRGEAHTGERPAVAERSRLAREHPPASA